MTDDLVAWLRAQVDEDEQVARATDALYPWVATDDAEVFEVVDLHAPHRCDQHEAGKPNVCSDLLVARGEDIADQLDDERAAHIARHDPARVLAEVAAKRRIIDRYEFVTNHGPAVDHVRALDMSTGARAALLDAVKMLASVYAGRPGWRAEWAADEEVQRG